MKSATLFSGFEGVGIGMRAAGLEHVWEKHGIIPLLMDTSLVNKEPLFTRIHKQGTQVGKWWLFVYKLMDIPKATIFSDEIIRVHLGSANRLHYKNMGYEVDGKKDILITTTDLPRGSGVGVTVMCPKCKSKRTISYQLIVSYGHSFCKACVKHLENFQDISGKRFRSLVAIEPIGRDNQKATIWLCLCDCGKQTKTTITRLNNGMVSSCGCLQAKKTREAVMGERNVNYNPDLTDDDRVSRRITPEYREWRLLVKKRDNYTCGKCSIRGGKLTSHHLYSWRDYPDLRYELSNGVCLCLSCHMDFHNQYGRGGNTKEQYEEWSRC